MKVGPKNQNKKEKKKENGNMCLHFGL